MSDKPNSPEVAFLRSDAVLPPGLPFDDGVRVGNLVILSGQIGIRPGTMDLVPGGIAAEARQTFDNIRLTLEAHGLTLKDVMRVQVMLADMADWPRFNEIYRDIFPNHGRRAAPLVPTGSRSMRGGDRGVCGNAVKAQAPSLEGD
ncbi:MAG: RidA family protein [Xanthobacteraceae bacterium]